MIDGQQRTLAMLIAWPGVDTKMDHRLWVDFGEDDNSDHLLRFHLTTVNQPFGYQRGGNSGEAIARLSLSDRRLAAAAYDDLRAGDQTENQAHDLLHHEEIAPWKSTLAMDLRLLIKETQVEKKMPLKDYVEKQRDEISGKLKARVERLKNKELKLAESWRQSITSHLQTRIDDIENIKKNIENNKSQELDKRIEKLSTGLERLFQQHFPVIEVPEHMMDDNDKNGADDQDPPLAILFKRIGTSGTRLSAADYVYSVIKHHNPGCHSLVETLLFEKRIAAIYSATSLVMSAVRLAAAKLEKPDAAPLEVKQFIRLLREDTSNPQGGNRDEKKTTFLKEFDIQISQEGNFVKNLKAVMEAIAYTGVGDIGFPKHALCLVQIPALEVILRWMQMQKCCPAKLDDERHLLIRFLLRWYLTVLDSSKASMACYVFLKEELCDGGFPEQKLTENLVSKGLALPIFSPEELEAIPTAKIRVSESEQLNSYLTQSGDVKGLRGLRRFQADVEGETDESVRTHRQQAVKLYERWWNLRGGYSHKLLLWLQRDYVSKEFEEKDAQPGMEDDTPYDFDHICPQSHWSNWTGHGKGNRLIDFHAEKIADADAQGHWRLGNAIGNVRVWDSSDNRADGDGAPTIKLKTPHSSDTSTGSSNDAKEQANEWWDSEICKDSIIGSDEMKAWRGCSPSVNDAVNYLWTKERAISFQKAIEQRTFNLYKEFYKALKFDAQENQEASKQEPK